MAELSKSDTNATQVLFPCGQAHDALIGPARAGTERSRGPAGRRDGRLARESGRAERPELRRRPDGDRHRTRSPDDEPRASAPALRREPVSHSGLQSDFGSHGN